MALRKGRAFCFTLNNYTPEDEAELKANTDFTYIIYGHEVAPTTNTPHLQGYVQFAKQVSPSFVKKINKKIHWITANGNVEQNKKYCSKGTDIFEKDEASYQGKRTDIVEIRKKMIEGKPMIEIIAEQQTYQAIRLVEKLYEYKPLSAEYKKKEVYWLYGETGTGKTRHAIERIKESGKDYWRSNIGGGQWFNGYAGQPIALLDEVRAGEWKYSTMLQILDGYELRCPTKGGFTIWNPEIVYITSPKNPEDTYAGQLQFGDGHIDQLKRRITETIHFEEVEAAEQNPPDNVEYIEQ